MDHHAYSCCTLVLLFPILLFLLYIGTTIPHTTIPVVHWYYYSPYYYSCCTLVLLFPILLFMLYIGTTIPHTTIPVVHWYYYSPYYYSCCTLVLLFHILLFLLYVGTTFAIFNLQRTMAVSNEQLITRLNGIVMMVAICCNILAEHYRTQG